MDAFSCFCRLLILLMLLVAFCGCSLQTEEEGGAVVLVFKHGRVEGDRAKFRQVLDRFERAHPGIRVRDETLPPSTDEQHQFYVINLEGESRDFDVISMDVVWIPEFARAGWLRPLDGLMSSSEMKDFFPGPVEAATFEGKLYALPWFMDAGLLYYRRDLLWNGGFYPPDTWLELAETASALTAGKPELYGFLWQGKQGETLVCDALEFMRSNGGEILRDGRSVIDSPQNAAALSFMRRLITSGVSPPLVTGADEEATRRLFGAGKGVFMRNWPYAWDLLERKGSAVRKRTGFTTLPAFEGGESAPTLGGWEIGVNRFSRHPREAELLARHLASLPAQRSLALYTAYKPTRRSLYHDSSLAYRRPFMAALYDVFLAARPRPVSPYYTMITQVLQPELSAAVSGVKSPEAALHSAQRQVEHLLKAVQ